MTPRRLLWQSLLYHWRGNVAVFLGVAVATAVLTGALLVGDSLQGSLRAQVIEQLGWVDRALVSGRFIREELASGLSAERSAPLILLRGAATRSNQRGETVHRAGRVSILGVNDRFWTSPQPPDSAWQSSEAEVVLNQALADELSASIGDSITLHMQRVSNIPRDTLLGQRDTSEVLDSLDLRIREIMPNAGQARFSLRPGMEVPHNAFVPLGTLQAALFPKSRAADKKAVETTRAPLINALVVAGAASDLQQIFNSNLSLDDWGLVLKSPKHVNGESRGYLNLESRQLYVEPAIAGAAMRAAEQFRLRPAPTLVYLANSISDGKNEIPYSVVVALDPAQPTPLGPFLPESIHELKDDEIVLVDWPESPLNVKPGDLVTMTYYQPEQETRLVERTTTFRLRGLIPLVDHRDLAPEFPGLTDRLTIKEWKPPFDIDQRRIKGRDERFWSQYRTTPKAFVTLAAGQNLWSSRFGAMTSIRLAPEVITEQLTETAEGFTQSLLSKLRPEDHGLAFEDVRARALEYSLGSADFGMYFLGFSFFLIVAALLLVSLLSRLNLERRASEIGVLLATGYRRASVRRLLVSEGILVAAGGSFIGVIGAMAYAWLLLELLRRWWPGQLDRSFLRLHVGVMSLMVGYAASLIVTSATIVWAIRALARGSTSSLLAGQTPEAIATPTESRSRWSVWLMATSVAGAVALLGLAYFIHDHMTEALTFFGSGALLLTACLSGVWAWMRRPDSAPINGHGVSALARLGIRNAARHPLRSLLTIGLLGFAVFVIIAVGVFHRSAGAEGVGPHSGTGGFALIGESTLPIYQDLNTEQGQDALNIPDPPNAVLQDVWIANLRLRTGDDTSCANLYQPTRPQILGVPDAFVQLNRFRFRPPSPDNPWTLLHSDQSEEIPVIVDATTAQFILKKNVGDTIEISDERGEPARLRIAALLADSVLQSQLLVSEANFLRLFPSHEGYQFYLIESPAERTQAVKVLLETSLAERGFSATPTAQRLAAYWAVENTYLATFQALGGLGLLLGALGLAVVLLRTVWERRSELALFRAVGYRRSALNWLLLSENAFLVTCGLVVGMIAACVAVLPHVGRTSGEIHPARLAGFVVAVLAVGLIAGAVASFTSLRAPLVSALRHE